MNHYAKIETETAVVVMRMPQSDVAPFVSDCVRNRSLSKLVAVLNRDLLRGSPEEKDHACKALRRIGFI